MKRLSTLVLASVIGAAASAQCSTSLTFTATVVDPSMGGGAVPGDGTTFWVCSGFTGAFTGSNNIIFVETGANVGIGGNDNSVRTKSAGVVVTGSRNTFYARNTTDVTIAGGTNNVVNPCASGVTFGYTTAPSPGCLDIGIPELVSMPELLVAPNPFMEQLVITPPTGVRVLEVLAMDLSGRIAARHSGPDATRVDTGALSPGTYLLQVVTDRGIVMRRVSKA